VTDGWTDSQANAPAEPHVVSGSLLAYGRAVNAPYIVLGGYSHTRVAQYLFGGVTRTMLSGADGPLEIGR
jgi:nucleotide-binding universal stress UspA family protein